MMLKLQSLLDSKQLAYKTIRPADHLSLTEDWADKMAPAIQQVQAQILQDRAGMVLCLFPASHELQPDRICQILHRSLSLLEPVDQEIRLAQLSAGIGAPFAKVIVDEALSNHDTLYFRGNNELQLLALETDLIEQLHDPVLLGRRFSEPRLETTLNQLEATEENTTDLLARLKTMSKLPVLPQSTQQLLHLRDDPKGTVSQLVMIIEGDASLAAQITRYANSALFGMRGRIQTLHDAIFRVMGYETTLHLSLGISMAQCFELPVNGPLGGKQFWQHASYSAALCQKLATLMPRAPQVQPGVAFLGGLLHDIGTLAMAQLFHREYAWLNQMAAAHPREPVSVLEARLLGTTHMQLGEWLLTHWGLPVEMAIVAGHHHSNDYSGTAEIYVRLVGMVDRLLKPHGLSDADSEEVPDQVFAQLGLKEEGVYEAIDQVVQNGDMLAAMVTARSA
ncbi:MAG: HDOD domain-containing protein [Gammaproteobacteria bacterium]